MKIVVDGVFFQLTQSGIGRVWAAVLPRLAAKAGIEIVLLDRGGAPDIPGVSRVPFPTYSSKFNAQDSLLLEQMCRQQKADLFISTYYTTPLKTPSLLTLYDMIPERFGFDMAARDWREKELAIAHARRHLVISEQTGRDLVEYYPELDPAAIDLAYCGVDDTVFKPTPAKAQAEFRARLGLERDYFLFVGSRVQHKGYKNSRLFFEVLPKIKNPNFDVLCVGGEPELEPWIEELAPEGCNVKRVELSDADLALAYGAASALVYPSLYEGFGMPVAEAMACRCPVITTNLGSIAEVAGSASHVITGRSKTEMAKALTAVRDPATRQALQDAGEKQAAKFRWNGFADVLATAAKQVVGDAKTGQFEAFYDLWANLRRTQGGLDIQF